MVIAIILVATGSGKSKPPTVNQPAAKTPPPKSISLLQGIPQNGITLGNPNAPVTMKYFGDLECPICKEFTLGALPGSSRSTCAPAS